MQKPEEETSDYEDKHQCIHFLFIGEGNRLHLVCLESNLYTLLERIYLFHA